MTGISYVTPRGRMVSTDYSEEEILPFVDEGKYIFFLNPSDLELSLIEVGQVLDEAVKKREEASLVLVSQFQKARDAGYSITKISKLTGVSRQALHKIGKKLNAVHCSNPECPKAGRCGGECARNF